MLNELKSLNVRTASVDDLALALALLSLVAEGFAKLNIELPDWLVNQRKEVQREYDDRVRADREAKLQKLMARRAALATAEEKRNSLDAEIAALKQQLGL